MYYVFALFSTFQPVPSHVEMVEHASAETAVNVPREEMELFAKSLVSLVEDSGGIG